MSVAASITASTLVLARGMLTAEETGQQDSPYGRSGVSAFTPDAVSVPRLNQQPESLRTHLRHSAHETGTRPGLFLCFGGGSESDSGESLSDEPLPVTGGMVPGPDIVECGQYSSDNKNARLVRVRVRY